MSMYSDIIRQTDIITLTHDIANELDFSEFKEITSIKSFDFSTFYVKSWKHE